MRTMNLVRLVAIALVLGLLVPAALAGKGGDKGKPGGGEPSPVDALPGTLLFEINPQSSDVAWYASDANGGNLRLLPIEVGEHVEDVSVSPYPIHIIVEDETTGVHSARPLEEAGPGVELFTDRSPYAVTGGSVRFRYRDPNGGLGDEIDSVAFWGYDTRVAFSSYYYYSADLVRNAQGNITGLGSIAQLAATPIQGGAPAPRTSPDGMRIAYSVGDSAGWDDGIISFDITTGSTVAFPEFDAQTCVRRDVFWAPTPARDLWVYEIRVCGTSDPKKETQEFVIADVAAGTTKTILTSTLAYNKSYGMHAWSPEGSHVLMNGPGSGLRGLFTHDLYVVATDGSASPVRVVDTSELGRDLRRALWGAQVDYGN